MNEQTIKSILPKQDFKKITYETLYSMYKKEFIDCCENILIQDKNELLNSFFYKMQLLIKFIYGDFIFNTNENILELSKCCEITFITDIYIPMFNTCSAYLKKYNSIGFSTNPKKKEPILKNFRPHCLKDKKPLHTCLKKLIQVFNESTKNIDYVICPHCKKCYFSCSILMYCSTCKKNYFSEILTNNNFLLLPTNTINSSNTIKSTINNTVNTTNFSTEINENILYPATWEQYHCNIMNNEQMSCINCGDKFWLKEDNKLYCKKCKIELNPLNIIWTCIKCQKEFKSKAKIYNRLEYKEIKNTIRDALLYKKICKPINLPCNCIKENELDKFKFIHNDGCFGILYYGILENKNLIVCSCCTMMCTFEKFLWCCPICKKKFIAKNIKIYNNNKQNNCTIIKVNQENKKNISNLNIDECNSVNDKKNNRIHKDNNTIFITKKIITGNNTANINTAESNTIKDGLLSANYSGGSGSDNYYTSSETPNTKKYNKIKYKTKNNKEKNIFSIKKKTRDSLGSNNKSNLSKIVNLNNVESNNNNNNNNNNKSRIGKIILKNIVQNETINNLNNNTTIDKSINKTSEIKKKTKQKFTKISNKQCLRIKNPSLEKKSKNGKSIEKNSKEKNNKINPNYSINITNKKLTKNKTQKQEIQKKEDVFNSPCNIPQKTRKKNFNTNIIFNDDINYTKIITPNDNLSKLKSISGSEKKSNSIVMKLYNKSRHCKINTRDIILIDNDSTINSKCMNRSNSNISSKKNESRIKRDMSFPYHLLKNINKKYYKKGNIGEFIGDVKYKIRQTSQPQNNKINNSDIDNNNLYFDNINYNNFNSQKSYNKNELLKSKSTDKNILIKEYNESNEEFSFNNKNNEVENIARNKINNIFPSLSINQNKFSHRIRHNFSVKNNLTNPFHNNKLICSLFEQNINDELNLSPSNRNLSKEYNINKLNINSIINRREIKKNKLSKKTNLKKDISTTKNKTNLNSSEEKTVKGSNHNLLNEIRKIMSHGYSNLSDYISNDNEVINNFNDNFENVINDNELQQFNFDDYKIITQLGQGTFSKIYLVQDKQNKIFSMKKIILSDALDVKSVIKEFKMCYKLKHPNIVKILGLYNKQLDKTTYVVYLLMEVGLTDWEKEIKSYSEKKREYSEKELILIMKQLISALAFLQSKNVIHRDIKPQNILIFKGGIYKIADFGESKQIKNVTNSLLNGSLRGTELYMSPLLFNGLRNGQLDVKHNLIKSDVYSFGLCLLYAATLNHKNLYEVRKYIEMNSLKGYINNILKNKYSNKFIELIISMIEIYEDKRPDFAQLNEKLKNI